MAADAVADQRYLCIVDAHSVDFVHSVHRSAFYSWLEIKNKKIYFSFHVNVAHTLDS